MAALKDRRRLDVELVRRGLVASREQAQTAVASGQVLVGGAIADKPSRLVGPGEALLIAGPPPRFVSRGGDKLEAALDRFGIEVAGRRALDAGSSTGGFTDCLLQRGATSVLAVDVGRGQLHQRLLADARVVSRERSNIRHLTLDRAGGVPFEVVVADLSFISLRTVAPVITGELAAPGADLVTLVKPQFEAGRRVVSVGRGVVRDAAVWAEVLQTVATSFTGCGADMMGVMVSPLTGADGNVEFLAHWRTEPAGADGPAASVGDAIAGAVAEASRAFGSGS